MSVWCVLPLTTAVVSLVASARLAVWVWTVKRKHAGKLMPRQLWNLALADMFNALMVIPMFSLECLRTFYVGFGTSSESFGALDTLCVIGALNNIGFMTSLLIEVHIALISLLAICRFVASQRVLFSSLAFALALGVALGSAIGWMNHSYWDAEKGVCNTRKSQGQDAKACITCAALGVCMIAYVISLLVARRRAPGSVQQRAGRRARLFLSAAIVCWAPFVVYTYSIPYESSIVGMKGRDAYNLACGFLQANGFLNTCVYALHSRLSNQDRRARDLEAGSPHHSNQVSMPELEGGSPHQELPTSLTVAFHVESVEVYTVPSGTRSASEWAERQIDALEASRDSCSLSSNSESVPLPQARNSLCSAAAERGDMEPSSPSAQSPRSRSGGAGSPQRYRSRSRSRSPSAEGRLATRRLQQALDEFGF